MKKQIKKSVRNFQVIAIRKDQLSKIKGGNDGPIGVEDLVDG